MNTESSPYQPSPFYIAVIVYESLSSAPDDEPLYEESLVLIKATSQEEAEEKALGYINQPYSYKNVYGQTITWSLKHLEGVQSVLSDNFTDGTEFFARHFKNYKAYHETFLVPFPDS